MIRKSLSVMQWEQLERRSNEGCYVDTWQEAEEQCPCHTQKDKLLEFNIKPQQAVPMPFKIC